MIDCSIIAQALDEYDPDAWEASILKAEELRAQLLELFPRDAWSSMTLNRYALGQADYPDTFGRWMEFVTTEFSSMRGGNAKKHLIYFQAGTGEWWFNEKLYDTVDEAWKAIREGFVRALELAQAGRWSEIQEIEALRSGPALVNKTLSVYFPEDLLPINSETHLRHFLRELGEPRADDSALRAVLGRSHRATHYSLNTVCGSLGFLMFPHPHDCPTGVTQCFVCCSISRAVAFDLLPPPLCVRLRPRRVNRAAVPETAVHEDRDPCARKQNVRPTATVLLGWTVDKYRRPRRWSSRLRTSSAAVSRCRVRRIRADVAASGTDRPRSFHIPSRCRRVHQWAPIGARRSPIPTSTWSPGQSRYSPGSARPIPTSSATI